MRTLIVAFYGLANAPKKSLFPGNSYRVNTLLLRNISYSSMKHVLCEFALIGLDIWLFNSD
jgi:hypothetical protein